MPRRGSPRTGCDRPVPAACGGRRWPSSCAGPSTSGSSTRSIRGCMSRSPSTGSAPCSSGGRWSAPMRSSVSPSTSSNRSPGSPTWCSPPTRPCSGTVAPCSATSAIRSGRARNPTGGQLSSGVASRCRSRRRVSPSRAPVMRSSSASASLPDMASAPTARRTAISLARSASRWCRWSWWIRASTTSTPVSVRWTNAP